MNIIYIYIIFRINSYTFRLKDLSRVCCISDPRKIPTKLNFVDYDMPFGKEEKSFCAFVKEIKGKIDKVVMRMENTIFSLRVFIISCLLNSVTNELLQPRYCQEQFFPLRILLDVAHYVY